MSRRLYQRLRVIVAWLCQRLYRVEVEGASNIPRAGGCVLAANHDSSIDPALLALTTDRPIRFIARAELWQPGLRNLLDALGAIPIRRGVGDSRAMRRARRLLEAGELVAIFPQGTVLRFKNRRFRSGAARIALTTGVPLIPVRLFGTASCRRGSVSPSCTWWSASRSPSSARSRAWKWRAGSPQSSRRRSRRLRRRERHRLT